MTVSEQLAADAAQIEAELSAWFAQQHAYGDLHDAMRYSLLGGGKRLRPALTLAACRLCGGQEEFALPFACAVEMVHTYSLIHDDLPAMDDDDLRRGKLTNHKIYGEATAILAGDALQTAAFELLLSASDIPLARRVEGALCLARAAGAGGMVAGQVLDMAAEGRQVTRAEVEELEQLKTGALICAAVQMGAIAAGAEERQRAALRVYAEKFGLAFQVRDDILDVEGSAEELGKRAGSDAASQKSTFVTLLGLNECHRLVHRLTGEAVAALAGLNGAEYLCRFAEQMAERTN